MFESLSDKLDVALRKLSGQARINEVNVGNAMRDIKRALLDADVNYNVVKQFIEDVRKKSLGEDVVKSVSPSQMIVKIVFDELKDLLGGEQADLNLKSSRVPAVIMVAGLQGAGKTTFTAKKERTRFSLLLIFTAPLPLNNSKPSAHKLKFPFSRLMKKTRCSLPNKAWSMPRTMPAIF
jgi:hypothetical protein